ncbi:MAG TPA: ATP-binding protein [Rubrivivax sp.]
MNPAARAPEGPHAAALLSIAHDALLDHLNRSDAQHTLRRALDALSDLLACRCALRAQDSGGRVRWHIGAADAAFGAPAHGWIVLPLTRLDQGVGTLALELAAEPAQVAAMLDPLQPALAALLLHDAQAQPGTGAANLVTMIRSALEGVGTFVWDWDIESDRLGDIDRGLEMLGYPAGAQGITQRAWNCLIHPDDLQANHAAYLRHARGQDSVYEHAYRIKAADGRWRWYLERGRIVEWHADGRPRRMVGIQADITAKRAIEVEFSQAAARLEKIARHVPGVLFRFEMDTGGAGRFGYVSERLGAVFGVSAAALLHDAAALYSVVLPQDRKPMAESIDRSRRKLSEWRHEFRILRDGGAMRWVVGAATPQREADGSVAWHGHFEDVTEMRELEAVRRGAVAAAAANRAKTEFLSRMSHELRTPLNAVLGFAQLLEIDRSAPLAETQRKRVRLIREAGEHLLSMIGDLLDLTRIESGSLALQLAPVPLRTLVSEALPLIQAEADQRRVRVAMASAPYAPELAALADRTRLRQVLLNLLSNAVKYNRPGGTVELRVAPEGSDSVTLHVIDSGVGIAPEDLGQIFEPFQRGVHEGSRIEGTGIGLSITRSLVQLMNGRIDVQSTPGVGSTFSVTLPAAAAAATP